MPTKPRPGNVNSVAKALELLRVLERNFAHGYSPGELAEATRLSPSDITRYVRTMEEAGYAERIPETGRIRLSHRLAQTAVGILQALDQAEARLAESKQRLLKGGNHG